jgi:nitrate reductase gamma subunit
MTLLDFARGTAMKWSLIILVAGVVLRLAGTYLMAKFKDYSQAKASDTTAGGFRTIVTRTTPIADLEPRVRFSHYSGYLWHIGLFITVLFYAPHILWFKSILGFGWPSLPTTIVIAAAAITLGTLIALLIRRVMHPALSAISSFDDYLSWFVTTLPIATGLAAFAHFGSDWGWRYETVLAVHILSVELLFIYFPFGKLIHPFTIWFTRFAVGAEMERRGVRA